MKLRGRFLEKLPPEKKARMERTLRRMEEVRRVDEMRLRKIVDEKLEWAKNERQLGTNVLTDLDKQIKQVEEETAKKIKAINDQKERVKIQMIKLDGVLLALNDLVEESNKQQKELEKQKKADEAEAVKAAEKEAAEKAKKSKTKSKPKTTRKKRSTNKKS